MVENYVTKNELELALTNVESRLDARIQKLDAKIDQVEARLETRIQKLDSKIDQVESRLEAKIDHVQSSLEHLQSTLDIKMDRFQASFDDFKATCHVVFATNTALADMKADQATRETQLIKWMIGSVLTSVGLASGIAFGVAKLIH